MRKALLLIAHGSRLQAANEELRQVAEQLRQCGRFSIVESCFLELAQPDIAGGAGRCAAQQAECIIMLPYFLSAGVHVRRDLEQARQDLSARYPNIQILLAEPIGVDPKIMEIVLQRAHEAEAQDRPTPGPPEPEAGSPSQALG